MVEIDTYELYDRVQGRDPLHTYDDEYGGGGIHIVAADDIPAWLVVDAPADGDPTVVGVATTEDEALRLAEEARVQRDRPPDYAGVARVLGIDEDAARQLVADAADALDGLSQPWTYWVRPGSSALLRSEANWMIGAMSREGSWPADAIPLEAGQYASCTPVCAARLIIKSVAEAVAEAAAEAVAESWEEDSDDR